MEAHIKFSIALHERLRTHKFFTKDQCFYLNYHVLHKIICFGCVLESPR